MSEMQIVDLRSDTVTAPSAGMRRAMAEAAVGDDVFGEDPSVRELEERGAAMLGLPSALFVPTGSMGNQIAIHLQTRPGSDVLLEADCHVYRYELGAMAAWSGALPRILEGRDGLLDPEDVEQAIAPAVYYLARATLLVLENTHNHAGGVVLPIERQRELVAVARRHGLRVHLDGARIFHAAASTGCSVERLVEGCDTVMFCLSKGLGAPVGSLLLGSAELIAEARVVRKRMGGGMRQAGILAAGGLYALSHNLERIPEDHVRARRLAEALEQLEPFEIDPRRVVSNIVVASVRRPDRQPRILESLRKAGVLAIPMGPGRIRFVTHLDIDDAAVDRAIAALRSLDLG